MHEDLVLSAELQIRFLRNRLKVTYCLDNQMLEKDVVGVFFHEDCTVALNYNMPRKGLLRSLEGKKKLPKGSLCCIPVESTFASGN